MGINAAEAWPLAVLNIAAETGADLDSARAFLDSVLGRHFGDCVNNCLYSGQTLPTAIRATVIEWMNLKVGRINSRETGIPANLPYLTGFVIRAGIIDQYGE